MATAAPETSDIVIQSNYTPNAKQLEAHMSRARYKLYGGALGGGKSRWLVETAKAMMLRWPGIEIMLGRYDLLDLKRTTIPQWEKFVDKSLWDPKNGGQHNKSENWYRFFNGSKLYLSALKDWESWMSSELGWIGIEECFEVPEEVVNNLDTRLRWTTGAGKCALPECEGERDHPEHPRYEICMATNPTPLWPKGRFYDPWKAGKERQNHVFVRALPSDNPFLPPTYERDLIAAGNSPLWVRRMLEGDWTAFEGMVFSTWDRTTHVWRGPLPEFDAVFGGIDFGATASYAHRTTAVLIGRVKGKPWKYIAFWCYSVKGPSNEEFEAELVKMQKLWKVRKWRADTSQNRYIAALAKNHGLPMEDSSKKKGSRADGVNLISRDFEPRGKHGPNLMIAENALRLITGIEMYHEQPSSQALRGTGAVTTEPVRRDDDEVDALRYAREAAAGDRHPVVSSQEMTVVSGVQRESKGTILEARQAERSERLREYLARTGGLED